jgi:hypothetical protein
MAYPNRPELGWATIRLLAYTFVMLNHFDGFIAYFHFLNA